MKRFHFMLRSIVGRKIIAAVTGFILLSFLVLHAFGNLNSFAGLNADNIPAINAYADYLREMATPLIPSAMLLWLVRSFLILALVLHVVTVISLVKSNRSARQIQYQKQQHKHMSFASHWVVVSGAILLLFIISHISQFSFGIMAPFNFTSGDVYANLSSAFQHGWLVLFYLLALTALSLHLHHGIWSLSQTLGFDNTNRNTALRLFSTLLTGIIVSVFASIPLAFYFGLLSVIA